MRQSSVLLSAAVLVALSSACNKGPEGVYHLNKVEMKKSMEAEIAKMPTEKQSLAKFGLAMLDLMQVDAELKAGGECTLTTSKPSLKEGEAAKKEQETGTWRKDGEVVVISAGGKGMRCDVAGKTLTCKSDKVGGPTLVFDKS
jgi:hypothetical protein